MKADQRLKLQSLAIHAAFLVALYYAAMGNEWGENISAFFAWSVGIMSLLIFLASEGKSVKEGLRKNPKAYWPIGFLNNTAFAIECVVMIGMGWVGGGVYCIGMLLLEMAKKAAKDEPVGDES